MTKLFLIAVTAIVLSGCAHMQEPTKIADGNSLISKSYPSATFIVSDDYSLASAIDETGRSSNSDITTGGSSSYTNERFVYTRTSAGSWIDGIVSIDFLKLNKPGWTWNRNPEWTGNGVVSGVVQTSMGEMKTYSTFLRLPQLLQDLNLDLTSKNIHMCGAVMTLRQIPSGMARYKHRIDYVKPIRCSKLDRYMYGDNYLSQTGRIHLENLTRTMWADLTIVGTD